MLLIYELVRSLFENTLNLYYNWNMYATYTVIAYIVWVLLILMYVQLRVKPEARRGGLTVWQLLIGPAEAGLERRAQRLEEERVRDGFDGKVSLMVRGFNI